MHTDDCDVLVVGAGPAGSAAARMLARDGHRVILADQYAFPRDKVCGDGLIGDALLALDTLGLSECVSRLAVHADELRVYPPWGRFVPLAGRFSCLPREQLDTLLWDAARSSGADTRTGLRAVGAIEEGGRVRGARFSSPEGETRIRAPLTMLATGANATVLAAFGIAADKRPTSVAGRAYYEAPSHLVAKFPSLIIAYDPKWCPGYGWIFPSPGNRFNIGVGLFTGASTTRLRDFWHGFTTRFQPAAEIVRASTPATAFRGAPIRSNLADAQFGRPGLMVLGEAASMTYSASGEGIGKAMESGVMAAALASDCLSGRLSADVVHRQYEASFTSKFRFRYRAYAVAQAFARYPAVLSLLAARAGAGRFARQQLEDLIAERGDARRLFSLEGLLAALVR